jgi:copper homeostasis protein
MTKSPLLEICVETLDAAMAAERGGADRIELCENLQVGGVNPSADLMRAVRSQVHIPVFAMIRPRAGDFFYSEMEFKQMARDLAIAKGLGMDGVVLGLLGTDHRVDVRRTRTLVDLARPLPVTFHRAFDETPNLREALEDVIATGAARILTSGGGPSAEQGVGALAELVDAGRKRIRIMPGAGISAANIERILQTTRAREVHSGLSTVVPSPRADYRKFETEVGKLAALLKKPPAERSQLRIGSGGIAEGKRKR